MVACASCGDKEKKNGGKLSTKGKSEYASIIPLDGEQQPIRESIDGGIKYSIQKAEEFGKGTYDEYNPNVIKFSDDKFVMFNGMAGKAMAYYDGTFSIKDGTVKFSYENLISWDNNGDIDKINVDQEYEEADMDVINGESDKLDGLSLDEKKEMIKKEQEKFMIEARTDSMQKMNKTGACCRWAVPAMNFNDKWNDYALMPFIRFVKIGSSINYDLPNTLKTVDKFLCTDTYGIELKGKYKRGKDFTLEYDLEDTMEEDEQSPFKSESDPEELRDRIEERAEMNYGCDSLESTIEFSDGEWEWFNDNGDFLNNGKYEESKDYPGLIKMYIDEDSEKCPDYAMYTCPLLFYIDDDGEIYYPAFVKMK